MDQGNGVGLEKWGGLVKGCGWAGFGTLPFKGRRTIRSDFWEQRSEGPDEAVSSKLMISYETRHLPDIMTACVRRFSFIYTT